jgi:hypothetical protein
MRWCVTDCTFCRVVALHLGGVGRDLGPRLGGGARSGRGVGLGGLAERSGDRVEQVGGGQQCRQPRAQLIGLRRPITRREGVFSTGG